MDLIHLKDLCKTYPFLFISSSAIGALETQNNQSAQSTGFILKVLPCLISGSRMKPSQVIDGRELENFQCKANWEGILSRTWIQTEETQWAMIFDTQVEFVSNDL